MEKSRRQELTIFPWEQMSNSRISAARPALESFADTALMSQLRWTNSPHWRGRWLPLFR